MSLKAHIKHVMRHHLPLAVLPHQETEWWRSAPIFTLDGQRYIGFCHAYNCGWPTSRMTERSVELAVADRWLDQVTGPVIEIGAVTPYYWPGRLDRVVDPGDPHARVTDRHSLFDVDVTGLHVLSLSTLEHIGSGDYEQPVQADETPIRALSYLTRQCRSYCITVPFGISDEVDAVVFGPTPPVPTRYLVRSLTGNDWRECSAMEARVPLGVPFVNPSPQTSRAWANGLAVMTRRKESSPLPHQP